MPRLEFLWLCSPCRLAIYFSHPTLCFDAAWLHILEYTIYFHLLIQKLDLPIRWSCYWTFISFKRIPYSLSQLLHSPYCFLLMPSLILQALFEQTPSIFLSFRFFPQLFLFHWSIFQSIFYFLWSFLLQFPFHFKVLHIFFKVLLFQI